MKYCEGGDRKDKDVKTMQSMGILPPCYQLADISDSVSGHWLKICYKCQYLKKAPKNFISNKRQWMSEKLCVS